LFLGWLLLGFRNTNKKYIYALILSGFAFIIIFICLGPWTSNKLDYLSLWFLGALFGYVINKLDLYIQKKSEKTENNQEKTINNLKNKIKYSSLIISIILYILSAIRLLTHLDPYGTVCLLLLNASFFFFIIFSQYININIPKKIRKPVNFVSSYTYSLFLIQYSSGYIISFIIKLPAIPFIILMYILSNILAIGIAYYTELRAPKIESYLLEKFKLSS
jgi:hypothetical protein